MEQLFGSDDFNLVPHAVAMLVAYVLAFPIGWNREKEERSAGLRTFPLVAIASCGFIQAAEVFAAGHPDAMSRVVEGLLAGMGFIGGGAILHRENSVKGTATAASLWATGAIGVAAGLGSYDVAVMLSVVTFISLRLLQPLKKAANLNEGALKRTGRTKS
jgi:putative Mg2+ transporter-C (MgtC) family protein